MCKIINWENLLMNFTIQYIYFLFELLIRFEQKEILIQKQCFRMSIHLIKIMENRENYKR